MIPTRSALKKALKKQYITVNDKIASTATYIKGGESICLSFPEEEGPKKKLLLSLNVLFEDEYLAAIHKPAGILVSGNRHKTVANALPRTLQRSPLPDASTPQPVHRLDLATTGILLIGKTSSAIRALNKLFADKKVDKIYYAVTIGEMKEHGTINSKVDGKESLTNYSVERSVGSERFGKLDLVKVQPRTGRRHQIRKHFADIGHPILGDKEYGKAPLILKGKGLYLHAHSLRFEHPFKKEELFLLADLPERFDKIFSQIEF